MHALLRKQELKLGFSAFTSGLAMPAHAEVLMAIYTGSDLSNTAKWLSQDELISLVCKHHTRR